MGISKRKKRLFIFLSIALVVALIVTIGARTISNVPTIGIVYSDSCIEKYGMDIEQAVSNFALNQDVESDNVLVRNINDEPQTVYDNIVDLAENKCDAIVVICEHRVDPVWQAADEYPKIDFCVFAAEKQVGDVHDNIKCFNFAVHELRYADGYLAGLKLKEMANNEQIDATNQTIGYIADDETSENISAFSSMYLGAKAANEDVRFLVKYIGDEDTYDGVAKMLTANGCTLIATQGTNNPIQTVCNENNIIYCGFGSESNDNLNDDLLLSHSSCRAESYLSYITNCIKERNEIPDIWCGGFESGALDITVSENDLFSDCENVQQQLDELIAKISDSSLKVFDTSTWTVSGDKVVTSLSDDGSGTEYIKSGGYFAEGEISPNPQFAFNIDGIEILK